MNIIKEILSDAEKIEYGCVKEPKNYGNPSGYDLEDYINEFNKASSIEDLRETCVRIRNGYGFDSFCLGILIPKLHEEPLLIRVYDYDSPWHVYYQNNKLTFIDPLAQHGFSNTVPWAWHCEEKYNTEQPLLSKNCQDFFDCARSFDMKYCIQFPWRGLHGEVGGVRFSAFNTCENKILKEKNSIFSDLNLLNMYLHEALIRLIQEKFNVSTDLKLTGREREVLSWTANGKSTLEIAAILKITQSTVVTHLKSSYKKLGVNNKHHAVAKAVNLKLIVV